jgi:hypothetical protein
MPADVVVTAPGADPSGEERVQQADVDAATAAGGTRSWQEADVEPAYARPVPVRVRVSQSVWDSRLLRQVVRHPTVWCWTDSEGYERCHGTRREAEEAIDALG